MAQERFKAQWEAYAHLPPVRMTNRVRFHSATWSAYALLQRCYQGVFKNAALGRLRLLHRIHSFVGARKTNRTPQVHPPFGMNTFLTRSRKEREGV